MNSRPTARLLIYRLHRQTALLDGSPVVVTWVRTKLLSVYWLLVLICNWKQTFACFLSLLTTIMREPILGCQHLASTTSTAKFSAVDESLLPAQARTASITRLEQSCHHPHAAPPL